MAGAAQGRVERRLRQGLCPEDPAQGGRCVLRERRLVATADATAVIRLKQVEHVRNERNVLAKVAGHPFITTMVASFQSLDSLYMVVRLTLILRQPFSNVPSSTIALVVKSSAT